jgi:glycosyltransferase involved in cell wall biosynthesis
VKKLAIITSHPVQYNAPWFRLLAESKQTRIKVFYTWGESAHGAKYDPDFDRKIEWDIPLLEGYDYKFVENTAADPGTHHFKGIINPGLIKEIDEWHPDAVLIFGWNFHSHLKCIRYFHRKIPVIFRGDSTLLDERPNVKKLIRRAFLKWVYRHIDYALYVGENNKSYFLKHGLNEKQLVFTPHAIDNDRFAEPDAAYAERAKAWRAELGIAEDELVILYAGKLEPKKDPFFLIKLAKSIDNKRLKILIVGNGILENELKGAAEDDPRIQFLDFQNQQQMPIVYRLCDVFILPSVGPGETWGLAVNEAMASGRPIIVSSNAGCAVDLVVENRNGLVYNRADPEECKNFILQCLENKAILSTMSHSSRHIISQYSFHRIIDSIDLLLEKIINS